MQTCSFSVQHLIDSLNRDADSHTLACTCQNHKSYIVQAFVCFWSSLKNSQSSLCSLSLLMLDFSKLLDVCVFLFTRTRIHAPVRRSHEWEGDGLGWMNSLLTFSAMSKLYYYYSTMVNLNVRYLTLACCVMLSCVVPNLLCFFLFLFFPSAFNLLHIHVQW